MEITLIENGPISIRDKGSKVALCRCGLSQDKPLCDGSHKACQERLPGGSISVEEGLLWKSAKLIP